MKKERKGRRETGELARNWQGVGGVVAGGGLASLSEQEPGASRLLWQKTRRREEEGKGSEEARETEGKRNKAKAEMKAQEGPVRVVMRTNRLLMA